MFIDKIPRRKIIIYGLACCLLFLVWQLVTQTMVKTLSRNYNQLASQVFYDRNGKLIEVKPNARGNYGQFLNDAPKTFSDLLLKKEDRWFYVHPGVNPLSLVRDAWSWFIKGKRGGSSTITQQLVKILLANENDRSVKNKLKEFFYTESLEWRKSKQEILVMYLNSVYFGNLSQGLRQASLDYYNIEPESLSPAQSISLLATINSPSLSQPGTSSNLKQAKNLAVALNQQINGQDWQSASLSLSEPKRKTPSAFEVNSLDFNCQNPCKLTLDSDLNEKMRDILWRNLHLQNFQTARNGAIIVIKLPENQIVSMVGSPDPSSNAEGMQLNMAIKPRAIGSTSKPFIYMKAFEKGARPYSLVDDTEIKYQLGTGFDFFPKNFDGQYRGLVTLHQALDNSLNIPSVQVLGYVGLPDFYKFMYQDLHFKPQQPLENYELGIALGGLESDLTTWSNYFTLFPNQGVLKPLTITADNAPYKTPMADLPPVGKQVGKLEMVEMVNKILNDRDTGVDQFGIKSNLNLPYKNYAVKTGTSRDYHDSWTIGYTPDFLVGVWVGNSDNTAMKQITGLSGAAKIWHETMQLMYSTSYNKNTNFNFDKVVDIQSGNTLDFGLASDNYDFARNIMLKDNLILSPHDGDKFLRAGTNSIPLSAATVVTWSINGKFFSKSQKTDWPVTKPGSYQISAQSNDGKNEQLTIQINN